MTKMPHHTMFVSGFMLSGVFCFVVASLFMLSSISGHSVNEPFSMLTAIVCR